MDAEGYETFTEVCLVTPGFVVVDLQVAVGTYRYLTTLLPIAPLSVDEVILSVVEPVGVHPMLVPLELHQEVVGLPVPVEFEPPARPWVHELVG